MCKSESFLIGNYVGEHQIPTLLLFRLNAMSYGSLPQGQKGRTLSPSRLGTAGMTPSEQTRNITLSIPHGVRRSDSLPFILLPLFRVVCFHRFTFFIQVPLSLLLPLAAVVWGPFCYSRALSHGPPASLHVLFLRGPNPIMFSLPSSVPFAVFRSLWGSALLGSRFSCLMLLSVRLLVFFVSVALLCVFGWVPLFLCCCLARIGTPPCQLLLPFPPRLIPCGALAQFLRWYLPLGIWLQL